ncbi:hypothetical protein MSPP1_000105 [Malassezia sp. CBS 17886]|nr:hypothetical protein MSPP1_000105 [Malassezia sp. CBS 17886]
MSVGSSGAAAPHGASAHGPQPIPAVPADAEQRPRDGAGGEQYGSSARSQMSDFLVGSFLGPRRVSAHTSRGAEDEEGASLLGLADHHTPSRPSAPTMSSLGNASGFGTIRPPAGGAAVAAAAAAPSMYGATVSHGGPGACAEDADGGQQAQLMGQELRLIGHYTVPIWLTHLLELSLSVVSVFSLGHLGTVELAAASLAGMTANVTGFSVLSGLIAALDTLLPAAYTRNPHTMGLWTQRVGVIVVLTIPVILFLWLNAEKGLLLFGQEPEIAKLAGQFLAVLALGLPGHAVFELCRRFLQAQGLMHAATVVLLVVSPLNALANYLLVWGPERIRLGFLGAPLASAASMWVMAGLCFLQCMMVSRGTWDGWSRKALDLAALKTCAWLGFAGLLSLASEWWAWEIVGLVTAALGTTALAAQSVLLITSSITYQLPYGASVAASVRVGNLLGARHPNGAKMASSASLILSYAVGVLNSSVVFLARKHWGFLFSSDPVVVSMVADVLPILALFQCADCVVGIAGGILRGCGRQGLSAVINLTSYYVIGIPVGLVLTFGPLHLGLAGLWYGLTLALVYGAVVALWFVRRTDWMAIMHHVHATMAVDDAETELDV